MDEMAWSGEEPLWLQTWCEDAWAALCKVGKGRTHGSRRARVEMRRIGSPASAELAWRRRQDGGIDGSGAAYDTDGDGDGT